MKLTTCGDCCDVCKAFKDNYEKCDERAALSAAWKKYLSFDLAPEDIHCDGGPCCAVGLGFVHEGCQYKKCVADHAVRHCGECPEYPCSQFDDGRNISAEHLRAKLKDSFDPEEYERYVKVFENKFWVEAFRLAPRTQQMILHFNEMTMCGYRCVLCKAHGLNIQKQDERETLSRLWKKYYGLDIPPEAIYCEGCRNMDPGAKRVDTACRVRVCVLERGIKHCGDCQEYPCDTFRERRGLSASRAQEEQGANFNSAEYKEYLEAYDNETRLNEYRRKKRNG